MHKKSRLIASYLVFITSFTLIGTVVAEDAKVYIVSPANGAIVTSPVTVIFGLNGMGVAPAGVEKENTGHHHLIINADTPPLNQAIANDQHHRHFGGGQTQVSLELAPGTHTLQLVMGDKSHIPHNPPLVSEKISIQIK